MDVGSSCKNYELPWGYGDNKVVLMTRDPWTLYTYWEVNDAAENDVRSKIQKKGLTIEKSVLRIYEVIKNDKGIDTKVIFNFDLTGDVNNWYINNVDPGKMWMADIGILCTTGEFFSLVKSNLVKTPVNWMSDVCDGEWMCSEDLYYKMFAIAGGYDVGKSSLEIKELITRHLKEWQFSGGISSGIFGSSELSEKESAKL